jgi:DNA replicative helicase MCM subunit Mcm2 (Cdc46/Mcm family)
MMQPSTTVVNFLWPFYFPQDEFDEEDPRIAQIEYFYRLLGRRNIELVAKLRQDIDRSHGHSHQLSWPITICAQQLSESLSQEPDFISRLQCRPRDTLGSLGIALTAKSFQTNPNPAVAMKSVFLAGDHVSAQIIQPIRIENFGPESTFGDVKANTVSQLVALKGRVVRIDKSKCNIVGAMYWCPKCAHDTFASFEDGIYVAPSCPHGRY